MVSIASGIDGANNNLAADSGAVYVFTRSGSVWSQQEYIKASNTGPGDRFGISLSLSGDTLAVGADGEDSNSFRANGNQGDNSAADAGAVYVFTRTGVTWTQQAYLKASNAEGGDYFGNFVSLDGDLLAVAALGESSASILINGLQSDNSASGAGAVYVFKRDGTTWSRPKYVKAFNGEATDSFGFALSVSGDTIAVATPYEASNATGINGSGADNSMVGAGAVYVFRLN